MGPSGARIQYTGNSWSGGGYAEHHFEVEGKTDVSRILVFDLNHYTAGELHGVCSRGWAISDGGSTSLQLSARAAANQWLKIGRMVYIDHEKLPAWAGVIDTPWGALPPVQVTAYDIPYLLSLRSPDSTFYLQGTISEIVQQLVNIANGQEDMFIREGNVVIDSTVRELEIEPKPLWEQLQGFLESVGMEIHFYPEIENHQLVLYYDIQPQLGEDTGVILQDGKRGNCTIKAANVDNEIWNQVIGFTDQSTQESRLVVGPLSDEDSIQKYGLRNNVQVFKDKNESELEEATFSYLEKYRSPILNLTIEVADQGEIFRFLRPGNVFRVRATQMVLPGGQLGWEGDLRIKAMAYDEKRNVVNFSAEGSL